MVLPGSFTTFGMRYELSMTEFAGSAWDFIGDPRYADKPLLKGTSYGASRKLKRRM